MLQLIFSNHFLKKLKKIKKVSQKQIENEIIKHYQWLDNFKDLYSPWKWLKVLKWYLSSWWARLVVLLKIKSKYIPCIIENKESIQWNNISKDSSIEFIEKSIDKVIEDIKKWNFEEKIIKC